MGLPKCDIWKQLNVEHYQVQFVSKKVVHSRIHFEKDGFTPHNSTKSLMAMNINHVWKHASLYCTTREVISEHVVLSHLRSILYLELNARWAMPRTRILSKIKFLCKLTSRKIYFSLTFRFYVRCKSLDVLRKRIWEQNNNCRAVAESEVLSGKIVPNMIKLLSFLRKITSNTLHYVLWIEFIFW